MKALLVFASFLIFLPALHADSPFREVKVTEEDWTVTFHEEGIRYRIEIDGFHRGLSGYLQSLRLKTRERLQLIEKHGVLNITPGEKDGKKGISITMVYRNTSTGQKRTKMEFIANHGHSPKPMRPVRGN